MTENEFNALQTGDVVSDSNHDTYTVIDSEMIDYDGDGGMLGMWIRNNHNGAESLMVSPSFIWRGGEYILDYSYFTKTGETQTPPQREYPIPLSFIRRQGLKSL